MLSFELIELVFTAANRSHKAFGNKIMRLIFPAITSVSLLLTGCASGPPFNPAIGNATFQSYVQDSLSGKRSGERNINLRKALRGNPSSLRYFFSEAHQWCMSENVNCAEEVAFGWLLQTLLVKNGDLIFYELLAKEPLEVQGAVFHFLMDDQIPKDFYQTRKLKQFIPSLKFPLDAAYGRLG